LVHTVQAVAGDRLELDSYLAAVYIGHLAVPSLAAVGFVDTCVRLSHLRIAEVPFPAAVAA